MAGDFFCAYHDMLEMMEPLSDAERGRLFTACLEYSRTGEATGLGGNERFLFPSIRVQIDRDKRRYEEFSKKQAENGRKGGRPAKRAEPKQAPGSVEKPEKPASASASTSPSSSDHFSPQGEGGAAGLDALKGSEKLRQGVQTWLQYKQEKRQPYQPSGLKALIAQVNRKAEDWGEEAVIQLMESPAPMWRACWPCMKGSRPSSAGRRRAPVAPAGKEPLTIQSNTTCPNLFDIMCYNGTKRAVQPDPPCGIITTKPLLYRI